MASMNSFPVIFPFIPANLDAFWEILSCFSYYSFKFIIFSPASIIFGSPFLFNTYIFLLNLWMLVSKFWHLFSSKSKSFLLVCTLFTSSMVYVLLWIPKFSSFSPFLEFKNLMMVVASFVLCPQHIFLYFNLQDIISVLVQKSM